MRLVDTSFFEIDSDLTYRFIEAFPIDLVPQQADTALSRPESLQSLFQIFKQLNHVSFGGRYAQWGLDPDFIFR